MWHDEFDGYGRPDSSKWNYEQGYVRNYEAQYYTPDNAFRQDGYLVIEARQADYPCPTYDPASSHWRYGRKRVQWTSSSLTTRDRYTFLYGRVEVCARIPVQAGAWPAIWLLGSTLPWPGNGEVDMLEYYLLDGVPTILANACWAGKTEADTRWDSSYHPLEQFTRDDPTWAQRFHVWRMDWDKDFIRLYLDDLLLNEIPLSTTVNGELRQDSNTGLLIHDIAEIVSTLSRGMTLKAGTVIATGTPKGVGMGEKTPRFLKPGDVVACRIEGIGELVNPVV